MRNGLLTPDLTTGFGLLLPDLTAGAVSPPTPAPHTLISLIAQSRTALSLVPEPTTTIALLLEEP